MARQAGDNREQRRESAGAAAAAAASAQSGRFPHRASRPERGRARGEGTAGGGGRGRGRGRHERAARGGGARRSLGCGPVRPAPPAAPGSYPELDPGPSLASPAPGSGSGTCKASGKHLWGESLAGGRLGRDGTVQATIPACASTRARRWGNNDECRARRLPAQPLPAGPCAGAPLSGVDSLPRNPGKREWGVSRRGAGAALRNQLNAPETQGPG